MIKYIEMSISDGKKKPVHKYSKTDEFLIDEISNVTAAALIIPKHVVVVDFDGDNKGFDGEVYDDKIIKYFIDTYKPYWVRSKPNHCHLYFKKPDKVQFSKVADVVSLGGLIVDYLVSCDNTRGLAVVKDNGVLRMSESSMTEERLNSLPELPPELYPLYGCKREDLPAFYGMKEYDGRDNEIYRFVNRINYWNNKRRLMYSTQDVKSALLFIDNHLFKDPLGEDIIDIKIENNFTETKEYNVKSINKPLVLKSLADVNKREIEWIWQPYIPLGCLVAIVGDPGLGKTSVAIMISSIISNGGIFPYSFNQMPPSKVIFQNGEDDINKTTMKRMIAAGAKLDNILYIDEDDDSFDLSNVAGLEQKIIESNCRLVIIDPIQAYIPADVNSNDRGSVRRLLSPLKDIAQKHMCTIIYLMHKNKTITSNEMNKASGSGDFMAIARSVLSITVDDENRRYIHHIKSSLDSKGKPIEFKINNNGCIEFVRQIDVIPKKERPIEVAKTFINAYMTDENEVKAKDIKDAAQNEKISIDTLMRAKDKVGIVVEQRWENGVNVWYWVKKQPSIVANTTSEEPFDPNIYAAFGCESNDKKESINLEEYFKEIENGQ